jgi:hypothetical protein
MRKQQIEQLAYWLWQQRGMPNDSPELDWYLAEALLTNRLGQWERFVCEIPVFAFGVERRTG